MISSFICSCLYSKSQSADRSALPACTCQQTKGQREQEEDDQKDVSDVPRVSGRHAYNILQCNDAEREQIGKSNASQSRRLTLTRQTIGIAWRRGRGCNNVKK